MTRTGIKSRINPLMILIFGITLIGVWGAAPLASAEAYITKPSKYSVLTTIDRLEKRVKKRGMTVFARINHQAGAQAAGLSLQPSELLVFGSPRLGTPLIVENPVMGLVLPIKVLSYQGPKGKTWITYLKPEIMLRGSKVAKDKKIIEKMTKTLEALTRRAGGM